MQPNQPESVQLTWIEDSINQERESWGVGETKKYSNSIAVRILSSVVWFGMLAYLHLWYNMVWYACIPSFGNFLSRNLYCEARRVITRNHSRRKLQILGETIFSALQFFPISCLAFSDFEFSSHPVASSRKC